MWLLRFILPPVLCLTQVGCLWTPAERALFSSDHAHAYVGRGGPRNGHDFVVYPDVLAKWVREIPEIAKGTSADEVIRRLGEPDLAYENGDSLFWDPSADRIAVYCVVMDRIDTYEPMSSTAVLADTESIVLIFDSHDRYKSYWVDNPSHLHRNSFPDDWLQDQDLTSLPHAGPAATAP